MVDNASVECGTVRSAGSCDMRIVRHFDEAFYVRCLYELFQEYRGTSTVEDVLG